MVIIGIVYLKTLDTTATVVGMILFEVRIKMTLGGQRLVAERARHLHVEVQLLLVSLDVRLVVSFELECLAADAAGEGRQRERAFLLLLFLLLVSRGKPGGLLPRNPILINFLQIKKSIYFKSYNLEITRT